MTEIVRRANGKVVNAQDLKCGNVIAFRGRELVVLSSFTDVRHAQTIITAAPDTRGAHVVVLRLFRTHKIRLTGHAELKLEVLDSDTKSEVTQADAIECEGMIERY